jgi:hypothetical protein
MAGWLLNNEIERMCVERVDHHLILRYNPRISMEGLRKTMKNVSQGSLSLRLDLSLGAAEY